MIVPEEIINAVSVKNELLQANMNKQKDPNRNRQFKFENIPGDVFFIVREFLHPREFRRLMNANKSQFEAMRLFANYFNLTEYYSKQFYTDKEFRDRLLSKIPKKQYQLSLFICSTYFTEIWLSETFNYLYKLRINGVFVNFKYIETFPNVQVVILEQIRGLNHELPKFPHTKKLVIQNTSIKDLNNLSNIPNVSIINCNYNQLDLTPLEKCEELLLQYSALSHYEILGNYQKKITFINCNIEEVNHLYKVPHLYFEHCDYIQNISHLDCCASLTIKFNTRIMEFPKFSNVIMNPDGIPRKGKKSFAIRFCTNLFISMGEQEDEVNWSNLDSIYIGLIFQRNFRLPTKPLSQIRHVHLESCLFIEDTIGLGNIPYLILSSLEQLKSIEGLGGPRQQHVVIANCPLVEDFSSLQSIKKVEIFSCPQFKSISCVKNVQVLKLKMLPGLTSLVEFRGSEQLQSISLAMCNNVVSLSGLERVGVVEVADCNKLSDVSSLGKNGSQRLSLYGCGKVERVSHLSGLKELKIQNCPNIKDLGSFDNEKNNLVLLRANHSDPVVVVPKPSLWKQFKKAVTKPFH